MPSIHSYGATTFAACPVSARMVRRPLQHAQYPLVWCDDVCSSVYCPHGDHYYGFPRQCRIATEGDSGAQNDKLDTKSGTAQVSSSS
ncbi:uncharacterized protein TNCV_4129531 [Trichonephila clavipes]|nr:uncharacterized protein TNCV_4129531 [Trichonephila clavipes]